MIRARAAAMLVPLALSLLPARAGGAPRDERGAFAAPVYAVVRIGARIGRDELVGRMGKGLLCLGAAPIRWRQLEPESAIERREIVQDELEDSGVPVVPLGAVSTDVRGRPVLRLRALVTDGAFRLCARRWLVDQKALSGPARLSVEWRVESRASAAVERMHVSRVALDLPAARGLPLTSIYRLLLAEAARDAAAWLRTQDAPAPATTAPPPSITT